VISSPILVCCTSVRLHIILDTAELNRVY